MKLTELELKIVKSFLSQDTVEEGIAMGEKWFDYPTEYVIEDSGIEPKKARGTISSLVKKGVFNVNEVDVGRGVEPLMSTTYDKIKDYIE